MSSWTSFALETLTWVVITAVAIGLIYGVSLEGMALSVAISLVISLFGGNVFFRGADR